MLYKPIKKGFLYVEKGNRFWSEVLEKRDRYDTRSKERPSKQKKLYGLFLQSNPQIEGPLTQAII